jgi:hypothetical protein
MTAQWDQGCYIFVQFVNQVSCHNLNSRKVTYLWQDVYIGIVPLKELFSPHSLKDLASLL